MASRNDESVRWLLDMLDQAYAGRSWHGTNLRGSLRRMSAAEALWRPGAGRKCAAEIVLHAAYWKYTVRRRLLGQKRGSFAVPGSNWFKPPADWDEKAWKKWIALLESEHRTLRAAVAGMTPADLDRRAAGSQWTLGRLVVGAAAHDAYHTGQIQLLKRLRRDA